MAKRAAEVQTPEPKASEPKTPEVDPEKVEQETRRIGDRLRDGQGAIRRAIEKRAEGPIAHQAMELVLMFPRFVVLIARMCTDRRVPLRWNLRPGP